MEAALQRRVQRYGWDKAAASYDEGWSNQLRPAQDALLTLAAIQQGERVLDIACGTGLVTARAARACAPSGHVTATDLSAGMLDLARVVCSGPGMAPVEFLRMGAESLDLPDAAFDVALNALGLMYVPDVPAALREMHRVLAPGGRAVMAVWGARAHCGWADIFPIVDARVQSDVCPLFFALGTGDQLTAALREAGFHDVGARRISTVLVYQTEEAALQAAFSGGPVAMAYSRFDPQVRAAAHADYLASIERYRCGTGYRIPGEFVVAVGRK